ncbi:Glutaredoxin [Musa troglodytarum]|uniref:Glutaredoxin n=1 Tax=Musa troglodytarum TaxID=320322 RepID=A0A9E7KDI5_9LILI|nr:Glutaredoxin [Musa troglodytarum]
MGPLSPRNRKAHDPSFLLRSYQEKCPPGGENTVVLYTTTLRGIRKTFEDCNAVRSTLESYHVRIMERDISMDSGYREELRSLMGSKEAKVPAAFVRGRLIGGAEEVLRLEDEGKLELLLEGIPRAASSCEGCAGMRFIMCMDCSGSCKVLDEEQKKMVKCGVCNENGLLHCPICC